MSLGAHVERIQYALVQSIKMLFDGIQAAETDKMYKDLMDTIVCCHDSKECMVHSCDVILRPQLLSNPKTIEELQIKHFIE